MRSLKVPQSETSICLDFFQNYTIARVSVCLCPINISQFIDKLEFCPNTVVNTQNIVKYQNMQ